MADRKTAGTLGFAVRSLSSVLRRDFRLLPDLWLQGAGFAASVRSDHPPTIAYRLRHMVIGVAVYFLQRSLSISFQSSRALVLIHPA
jgi:hypothetical protein